MTKTSETLTNKAVIQKYGEYGVPYSIAKTLKDYDICYCIPFNKLCKLFEDCKANNKLNTNNDVLVQLNFGHIDLEFCIYDLNQASEFGIDTGFFNCCEYKEGGWRSNAFSDLVLSHDMLSNKDLFEKSMYESMIKIAKKCNKTWSGLN